MRFILLLLFFTSSSIQAAGYYAGSAGQFARFDSASQFYDLKYQLQKIPDTTTAPSTLTKSVKYSPTALKSLLQLRRLTPAGFILPVALTAAGYVFDELGNLVSPSTQTNPPPSNTGCTSVGSGSGSAYLMTNPHADVWPALCAVLDGIQIPSNGYYTCRTAGSTFANVSISITQDSAGAYYPNTAHCSNASVEPTYAEPPAEIVSDDTFKDVIAPQLDWSDVASDPSTGEPFSTPELTQEIADTNNWYQENYVDSSSVSNTTTNTTTVINQDGTETTTGTAAEEWPAFCSWAGIVCDFINWFQEDTGEPEIPALPVETIEADSQVVDWDSGLGAGSCPAATVTPFMGQNVTLDWQDECDAVSNIFKPILLFLVIISAGYIVSGVRN
jgi:hypothetical protein